MTGTRPERCLPGVLRVVKYVPAIRLLRHLPPPYRQTHVSHPGIGEILLLTNHSLY
jgi:hypothetical protein